jgi:lipopolysaccharide/colanic/teichoic acid biosynthesis glycosyltransferase
MCKRIFDIVAASLGLLLIWPLMLAIALAVRLDSPGPALFRQPRVARGGALFNVLKFRSMVHRPDGGGPLLTSADDRRITSVGAFLRRTKLDELPQLLNVLKGEMSFVGPRPEVPRYVEMYPADVRELILSVRPGITDEASIEFSNEHAVLGSGPDAERRYVEEVLPRKLDIYARYARNHTFFGDIGIVLRTLARIARH